MALNGFYLRPAAIFLAGRRNGGTREKSASRGSQMSEHMLACLVIHFSLETVPLLQRGSGLSCRASADLIKKTFEVRQVLLGVLTEDEGRHAGPAPGGHVYDGVSLTHHVALLG
jgi:hypothetical protein